MSRRVIGSKKIEDRRDFVERKGVFGKSVSGEIEVWIGKDGFERNVWLCHY